MRGRTATEEQSDATYAEAASNSKQKCFAHAWHARQLLGGEVLANIDLLITT